MKNHVVIAVLALLLGGLWFVLAHPDRAPRTVLTLLDGKKVELAELNKGKVVLVNFWATTCPGCVKEMPGLVDIYRGYHAKGFETVAVAMTYDHPAQVLNFTQSHGLPFVVALDVDGSAAQAFGDVQVTPTSFLLDQHGRIVKRITGEIDFPQLRTELNQLLGAG